MRNYESDAYRKYQSSIEQRQKVVRTSGSPYSQQTAVQGKGQRAEMSASTKRKRTREKEKLYYDYDLLLVIIFLMCFGLVMLYSSSAYSAQVDYKNDMFFFTRQAMIGIIGFIVMFIVSKIDYHLYGAYAKELFWFSMFLMALVQTPLGKTVNGARRWIRLPGGLSLQPAEFTKIAVILFIAYEICLLGQKAKKRDGIKILLGYGLVATLGVFLLTDNLSTAIIVFAITVTSPAYVSSPAFPITFIPFACSICVFISFPSLISLANDLHVIVPVPSYRSIISIPLPDFVSLHSTVSTLPSSATLPSFAVMSFILINFSFAFDGFPIMYFCSSITALSNSISSGIAPISSIGI